MITLLSTKIHLFFACALPDQSQHQFFFFPHWWEYLGGKTDVLGQCVPNLNLANNPGNLWLVGLAILDMLLRVAGFIAVLSIMIAGFELVRSEGSSEKATNARQRLINSLVGLAIAAGATALVTLVGNTVGGVGGGLPHAAAGQGVIKDILNTLFVVLGSLAVLFIILAGVKMVTSGDNSTKVGEARRQILYAALGLIVIAAAGSIVNFILGKIG